MIWIGWGLAGVLATLVMDVGGGLVRRTSMTHGAPVQLIGRFFVSVFRGHLTALDPSVEWPVSLGFILPVHYAIGIGLALIFGLSTRLVGDAVPKWWACVGFGVMTTALPALWMFPAMGFGLGGARGPQELLLFRTALVNHLLFGLGLALAATVLVPRFR
jgi:hypothetical protein